MQIVVESYKEIDLVKKAINEQCNTVLADAQKVFDEKQIDALSQIDEYLKGISEQLRGTKRYNRHDWHFFDGVDTYAKNHNGSVRVEFRDDMPYLLRITLDNSYYFKIIDGKLISSQYTVESDVQKNADKYAKVVIRNWKMLKRNIHLGILKDFEETKKMINDKLNKAQELGELLNNFEV